MKTRPLVFQITNHIHHVHIFASDLKKSLQFYQENFEGKVILDAEFAGARNVFMRVGNGRIHFYDQPPKHSGSGSIHHFGNQTENLEAMVTKLQSNGILLQKEVTDLGHWKYIMVLAPDNILIELFEIDKSKFPSQYL